jgi:hypothetical protein
MGLGSQDAVKKQEIKMITGRVDWKAGIKTVDDAKVLLEKFKARALNAQGVLMFDAYTGQKVLLLMEYIESGTTLTLKQYGKEE